MFNSSFYVLANQPWRTFQIRVVILDFRSVLFILLELLFLLVIILHRQFVSIFIKKNKEKDY